MINLCPFCGRFLDRPLNEGITTCGNCTRIFDTSPTNRLLAAAWYCRKNHLDSADCISEMFGLTEEQTSFIQQNVIDTSYCHDELIRMLKTTF